MKNNIEAIIFDFGGVIIDIEPQRTFNEFARLCRQEKLNLLQTDFFVNLIQKLEKGTIQPSVFRAEIKSFFALGSISDMALDAIWNKLLLNIPPHRVALLESLSRNYRLFMLSNSNIIHYNFYTSQFRKEYGGRELENLFEKVYFSFQMGLMKPDLRIYKTVIEMCDLKPEHTIFIDDTPENVESAALCGLKAYMLKAEKDISDLFDPQHYFLL